MYAFLLFLSLLSTAVGLFAVGFGLAPYELSLGNSLIVAGAVGIVGGMILFALAAAVRQLRRVADAVAPRQAAIAPSRRQQPAVAEPEAPALLAPPRQAPTGQRIPYPARPDARPAVEAPPDMPPERPRPNIFGVARGANEPPGADEEFEAMPLAPPPSRPPAAPIARGAPPPIEPPNEPRQSPADMMARMSNLATSPQRPPPPRPERPAAADQRAPAPDPQQRGNMFDAMWPAEARATRQSQPEAIARAPRPEPRPSRMELPKPEAKPPEPRFEPPPMARERMEPPPVAPPRERIEPVAAPPASEPRPIAILKSGVIDGMAYTLYTDGSIEAELPQGTMRFASIDELRAHLENAERQQ